MKDEKQESLDASQSKRVQSSFAVKDFIALGFSMLALTLSTATFYFSNFRIDNKLQARVAEITVDTSAERSSKPEVYQVVRVAFTNSGNRPAIVLGVMYQISDRPNTDTGPWGGDCGTAKTPFRS
jgi:hypothetical protein